MLLLLSHRSTMQRGIIIGKYLSHPLGKDKFHRGNLSFYFFLIKAAVLLECTDNATAFKEQQLNMSWNLLRCSICVYNNSKGHVSFLYKKWKQRRVNVRGKLNLLWHHLVFCSAGSWLLLRKKITMQGNQWAAGIHTYTHTRTDSLFKAGQLLATSKWALLELEAEEKNANEVRRWNKT